MVPSIVFSQEHQSGSWEDSAGVSHSRADLDRVLMLHTRWLAHQSGGVRADLHGATLSGANFSGAHLKEVIFNAARLQNANFSNADLENSGFDEADVRGANFQNANLTRAGLGNADLQDANLRGAQFRFAEMAGTRLNGAHLDSADLSRARNLSLPSFDEGVYYDEFTKWPLDRNRPDNLHSLRTRISTSVLSAIGGFLNRWAGVLLVVMALLLLSLIIVGSLSEKKTLAQQQQKVQELEAAPPKQGSLPQFVQGELGLLIERERVTMLLARSRSSRLFTLGTALTVLSVLAPVVTIFVYLSNDPLDWLQRLSAAGVRIDLAKISLERDWHVLLSGASFGFVLLAAAAAVLAQARHQVNTYITLGQRVTHYESMASALRISERISETELKLVVNRIVDVLMAAATIQPVTDERSDVSPLSELSRQFLSGARPE